jgi:hypothetical protein
MGQSHSMATWVGVRAGGLVQGQLQWPLTAQTVTKIPVSSRKGSKLSGKWLWAAGWTLHSPVWGLENTFLSGWFFQSRSRTQLRKDLERFRAPTRVSKLGGSQNPQDLLG